MSAAPRRRRNWRRILLRLLIVLVGLRLLLALLLSWLIGLGAGAAGLDATLGDSSLTLLGGHLQLASLELRPRGVESAADVITLGGVDVDLDMEALLGGTVRLTNVSIDDASIALSRSADGRWPLLDALAGGPSAPAPERAGPAAPAPPDFRAPLEIDHLAVQPINLRVEDALGSPPRVTLLEGSLRLTGLRGDGREARLELRLDGRDSLDMLRMDGSLAAQREQAHATLRLDLAGLRPHGLSALLAAAGLRAAATRIDAGLDLSLDARVESGQAQVALELQQLRVLADGTEALALDALLVGPQAVRAHGLRAALAVRADGALGVAGLDLLPGPPGAPAAPPEPAPPPASPTADTPLPSLELTDAHLTWRDERRGAQAALAVDLARLSFDASAAAAGPNVQLQLAVPGVVQEVALAGRVDASGSQPAASLELKATGVNGTGLDPFLASAGWATEVQDGALTAGVDVATERDAAGVLRGRASLHDVVLSDGDRRLAQFGGVTLEGLEIDPATSGLRIGSVSIDGPVVGAERDVQGVLRVAGLRSVPPVPLQTAALVEVGAVPAADAVAAPPAAPDPAPLVALDNVRWRGAEISLNDVSVQPPVELRLRPELDGAGLRFGGDAPGGEAVLRVGAEGVWETCSVRLALRGGDAPGDVRATLALDASDVQAAALRGWLTAAGISTRGLHASLGATLELTAGAAATDLRVVDLMWQEGQQTVLSVPEIRVSGLRAEGGGTHLDALEVPGLDLYLARAADGAIDFGNLSILPADPALASAPAAAPTAGPAAEPPPAPLALGALRFGTDGARLHWRDKSVSPAAEVELSVRASLDGLVLGAPAPPASVQVQLAAPGVCESLDWSGTLSFAPDAQELDGALDVRGVRLDALAGYLPPGCRGALRDGRLALRAKAQSAVGAQGGRRAALQVSDVAFRDGEGGEPLLALQSLALDASRLDPDAGVAVVDDVAVQGLAVHAERRPDGTLAVMGLEFAPVPADVAPSPAAAPASAPPAARPAGRLASMPLRDLRVEHVDVELSRFELTDASGAGGVPLVVAARLSNPEPLVLLDRSVDDLAPCKLELRASALPLARTLDADLFLDASSSRPGVELDLRAEGLRGAGLTEVLPELAARVDGSGLTDGSFHAHLGAELSWPRRGPLDLDMSGGLSGDVELTDVAFRAQPEGEVLLGCERLDVGLADVRPTTGAARLSSVELTGVRARLGITPDGIAALGLLVRPPPAPPPAEAPVPPPAPLPPGLPGPEVRIDLFSVSGLDFVVRDETCTPPMLLPLTDLELEVRGWSSWAHVAPRPLRFTGSVRGGLVPLPWRERKGVVQPAGSRPDAEGLQERPVFDELALQGRVTQFPETTGWVNASLAALELPAFAGPAAGAGVTIDDGLLDVAAHVRYARGAEPRMSATLTFTSLSLSESSGGPIASFLNLPAPLDTVVFLLRNNEGQVSIPLDFELPPEGFGGGRVLAAAAGAMGSVIGRAVASSPLRLAGTVTDFVGVTDSGAAEAVEPPLVLDFAPGDPAPPPGTRTAMAQLAERLLEDDDLALVLEHHFSAGDAQRALELGNPSPEDATLVAERLRLERAELLRRRDEAAAEARALLAVGREAEADAAAARLRDADRALGAREDSLDRVLGLLDKGAERRAPQRARGAGVEFGEARLRELRAMLVAAGGPELLERVELRPVRFVPDEEPGGGRVTLTLKARPHSGGLLDWMFGWIPKLFSSSPPAPEEGS